MKVLVTGAAGFIGSHVVDRLLARGDEVVGLDNFDPYYSAEEKKRNLWNALSSEHFRLVEADVADPSALTTALLPYFFDAVVHLAAKVGIRTSFDDPLGFSHTNVLGTHAVLELARAKGARTFIFGSSSSVYGDAAPVPFLESEPAPEPISPYAATKRAGELLCEAHQRIHGGSVLCLRFFSVYGPRQRPDLAIRKFSTLIAAGQPVVVFGDGTTERDYTWIGDIVNGVLAAVDRGARGKEEFQIINLGAGRATKLLRLVELIGEALGRTPDIVKLPPQRGDVGRTLADLAKARRLLSYEPMVSIELGIPRMIRPAGSVSP
ncbi:MAG: NAD-dependent epimerase/dehydratase family protein [Gemmatimonadetes bacterium]|nr:NAD-dependent epimerase/dehydratase family protein [Gemmatimonadota bacterium]